MASTITLDIIDGASHEKTNDNGRISESATRIAIVGGISSSANAASALLQARALVEAAVPLGTSYGVGSFAIVTGFRSEGIAADDDTIRVHIIYSTPFGEGGSAGEPVWMIEDDSESHEIQTQLSPNPAEGELAIAWANPLGGGQVKRDIATATIPQKWRRVILTGILTTEQVATYRNAQDTVNEGIWQGKATGYWWFDNLRTNTRPGASFYYSTASLVTKKGEDWSTYQLFKDPDGKFVNPGAGIVAALRAGAYQYGVQSANGVLKIGPMPTLDFNTLFNITLP